MHKKKCKKPGFVWVTQIALAILMLVLSGAGALAYYEANIVPKMQAEQTTAEVEMIGRALIQYSMKHTQVHADDVRIKQKNTDKEHIYAPTHPLYPESDADFHAIRNYLGYFVQFDQRKEIDDQLFSKITYRPLKGRTDFELEVLYPNGRKYKFTKADVLYNGRTDPPVHQM